MCTPYKVEYLKNHNYWRRITITGEGTRFYPRRNNSHKLCECSFGKGIKVETR